MQYFLCEDENALFVSLDQIHCIKGRPRNRIEALENQLRDLTAETEQLQGRHRQLQEDYQLLQETYQLLHKDHQALLVDHQLLQEDYQQLLGDVQKLRTAEHQLQQLQTAQQESTAFGIDPWKVSHDKVDLGDLIGGGGWGAVNKGKLHVAIKQIHPNILSRENIT